MEIKVNDYVRTKEGYICKILKLNEPRYDDGYLDFNDINSPKIYKPNIVKASPNIIDLIAKDDLLKIIYPIGRERDLFQEEITQVIENEDNKLYIKLYTEQYVFLEDLSKYDIKIKSIVTKEMFEQMEYKVGEIE